MLFLGTFHLPASMLTPYPGNPRRGDLDTIRESVRTHGQYRSIVVRAHNRDDPEAGGVVLAGNHTLRAIMAERAEKGADLPEERASVEAGNAPGGSAIVRVEMHDLTDDQAAKIVAVDNRSGDRGEYDERLLAELLTGLDDLDGTGYTADDLDSLARSLEDAAAPGAADLLDPPDEDNYAEQYGVIVTCEDDGHQQQVYEVLTAEGYNCRVVTV